MEKEICECKRDYKSPLSGICELCWDEKYPDEEETIEESKKSFGEIWSSLTTEQSEYLKGYINRRIEDAKQWQAERMYSEEDMEKAFTNGLNRSFDSDFDRWFEQFKKK